MLMSRKLQTTDDDYDDEEGSIWEDASQEDEEYDDDDIYELPDQNRHDAEEIPTLQLKVVR